MCYLNTYDITFFGLNERACANFGITMTRYFLNRCFLSNVGSVKFAEIEFKMVFSIDTFSQACSAVRKLELYTF